MAILYPHRQTLLIVIICIAAVGSTAWYVHRQNLLTNTSKPTSILIEKDNAVTTPVSPTKTDDWRNQFLSTEPKTTPVAKKTTNSEPLTLTDQMGRNFFTNYIYLQQGGLTNNDQAVKNAVNEALSETASRAPLPKTYAVSSIISYTDDSKTSTHAYGNAVALAFSLHAPRADSAEIAVSAFDNEDMSLLAQIDPIIKAYANTISALLTTPVPSSLANQHINLLNGLSTMKYAAEGLRVGDKDPMQALMGISSYGSAQNSLQNALKNLKSRLDSQNISYTSDEPGIAFLSMPNITY